MNLALMTRCQLYIYIYISTELALFVLSHIQPQSVDKKDLIVLGLSYSL